MTEKIFFKNSKGDKLYGILSLVDKERSIVILCHGRTSSKNSPSILALEKKLNANKISTFRFDFYGHGESDGKFEDATVSEAADDISNAIKLLKKQGHKKIGLVGSSFGGAASILAASKSDDLSFLVLRAPVSDYYEKILSEKKRYPLEEWKKKRFIYHRNMKGKKFLLNYSFFEDIVSRKSYEIVKKIKIPVLIVHGDKDEQVPLSQSKKSAKLIKKCKLKIIKGADHIFSKPEHFNKVIEVVSDFIIKHS